LRRLSSNDNYGADEAARKRSRKESGGRRGVGTEGGAAGGMV
jgi:hypothetical protein